MRGFFDRMRGNPDPAASTGSKAPTLIDAAITCFRDNDWRFHQSEQPNVLRFGFSGNNANFEGVIFIDNVAEDILVLFRAPNKVPECRRLAVADFLARANYGMKFGALEMDYKGGEVRFKMSAVLREGQLSPQMVHAMVGLSLTTLDRHYPALMAVCFGNQLPSEAVKRIEGRPATEE